MTNAVSDEIFEQNVLHAAEPVLVDFYAEWCGPCKAMAPALDEVGNELAGKIKIVKLDVDNNPKVVEKYGIRAMPTLVLFKDGKPVARHVGALVQKAKLKEWVELAATASAELEATPRVRPRITEWKLTNGMDVVSVETSGEADVSIELFFKVGMADAAAAEVPGMANFVGRLMARAAAKAGDELTSYAMMDISLCRQCTSKDALKEVLQRGAKRLLGLDLADDDVEEERQAIAEGARKRPPMKAIMQLLYNMDRALFSGHPYGVSVWDWESETGKLSKAEAERFFASHFTASNAVLCVSGDVTADVVKRLVEETYGGIPAGSKVARRAPRQPALVAAQLRSIVSDAAAEKAAYFRKYITPNRTTAKEGDAEALELLGRVLQRHRRPVSDDADAVRLKVKHEVDAFECGRMVIAAITSGTEFERVDANVDAIINDISVNGPDVSLLESAKEDMIAINGDRDNASWTFSYGYGLAAGQTIEQIDGWPEAIKKVTAEDVQRVVQKYLVPERSVTGWVPQERENMKTVGEALA